MRHADISPKSKVSTTGRTLHQHRRDQGLNVVRRPFSLSIQPLTAFAILSYGKRDFAEAEGRKTEKEERCMRRRRGGGRGKKFNAGPEGRNLAKDTENQRGFA